MKRSPKPVQFIDDVLTLLGKATALHNSLRPAVDNIPQINQAAEECELLARSMNDPNLAEPARNRARRKWERLQKLIQRKYERLTAHKSNVTQFAAELCHVLAYAPVEPARLRATREEIERLGFPPKNAAGILWQNTARDLAIVIRRLNEMSNLLAGTETLSGYRQIDMKLHEIFDRVRKVRRVERSEIADFIRFFSSIAGIAGQSLQDNLFPGFYTEREFQREMKKLLRCRAEIGSELEEHNHTAGGVTDLSFRGIPLELKVKQTGNIRASHIGVEFEQVAQYVAGSDRRFGVICVLDCSHKLRAPGVPANDISFRIVSPPLRGRLPIGLGIVLIRGNLSTPSKITKGGSDRRRQVQKRAQSRYSR